MQVNNLTFFQHVNLLKGIFLRIGILFVLLAIVNFYSAGLLLEFFSGNYPIVSLKPFDTINALLVIDFALTVLMLFPVALFWLLKWVVPAIKDSKNVWKYFFATVFLFYFGVAFGLFVFSSTLLKYFAGFSTGLGIETVWGINYLISFLFVNALIFGFIFQIPIIVFLSIYYKIFDPKKLAKKSTIAIPFVFFVSAWVTPPDIGSALLMTVPIIVLFYVSIFLSFLITKGRDKNDSNGAT